ncbi:lipopolysaccharide biosynthesis protein [Microbacterium sp. MRS-1]|uniref:lipopolysaccharide biosynthesis protein n=1 Tax=Microbacterium sp. MRS-1 TaxID=1451261 RepID=UPI0009DDDFE3|nr:lipopolysaccharide biosynthesis protein [Microbacterium sp. MRS-1]
MLRNLVTTYLARFAVVLSTFVLVPIVAPSVGLPAYGMYALVSSISILFAQDLGVASATTRFVAEAKTVGSRVRLRQVSTASSYFFLSLSIVVSAVVALVFVFVLPGVDAGPEVNVAALGALGVLTVSVSMGSLSHRQILAGVGRLDAANAVQVAQAVIRVAGTVIILIWWRDVVAVALIDLIAATAGTIAVWALRRRLCPETNAKRASFRWSVLKELLRFSADLLVLTLAAAVILQAGTVLSALLLPLGAAAVYSAANRAFLLVREAANSITTALLPTATVHSASGNHSANGRLLINGTRLANAAMIGILAPVVVLAHELLEIWVGSDLAAGYVAAQILILSMLANNNHVIATPILIGMGRVRAYAILHATWAVVGIALAPLLAPIFGIGGVALALSLPVMVLEPVYISIAVRIINVRWQEYLVQSILRPYAVAAAPIALFLVFRFFFSLDLLTVLGITVAWLTVYFALAWRLSLDADERAAVVQRLLRRKHGEEKD